MREKELIAMSRKIKVVGLALVAVMAFSAIAASAQAAPAPRWKVAGAFLANGATKNYEGKLTGTALLEVPGLLTLESTSCTASGKIVGSAAETSGKGKESVLKCSGIKVKEAPACEVANVETNKMKGELGWMNESGGENIATFEPEVGTEFTTVSISECALEGEYTVTGATLGTLTPAETEVEEGTLAIGGADTTTTEHWFTPGSPRPTMSSPALVFGGRPAKFTGSFDVNLTPKEKVGVFAG